MKKLKFMVFVIIINGVFFPFSAVAYVGPGAGLTLIGALIGAGIAIFLAIGAILLWPLRRLIKKIKKNRQPEGEK